MFLILIMMKKVGKEGENRKLTLHEDTLGINDVVKSKSAMRKKGWKLHKTVIRPTIVDVAHGQ